MMLKKRNLRWAGHVESMGERRSMHIFLTVKSEWMSPPGILCVNGRIILKLILKT
jgi:hypothetical protein